MRLGQVLATIILLALAPAAGAESPPPKLPAEVFGALPAIENPVLSPDGTYVAAKIAAQGSQVFAIASILKDGGPSRYFRLGDEVQVNWWRWVNDDWLVAGVGASQPFDGEQVYITRTLALQRSTGKVVRLQWEMGAFDGDTVVWIATDGRPLIKLQRQDSIYINREGHDPYPVTLDIEKNSVIGRDSPMPNVWNWTADRSGVIRAGSGYRTDNDSFFLVYRKDGRSSWTRIELGKTPDFDIDGFTPDGEDPVGHGPGRLRRALGI